MFMATLFFSLMNITVKRLSYLPTVELMFFRSIISATVTFYQLRRLGIAPLGVHRRNLILRGAFGSLGLFAYFFSLQYMPLASAVTLQYLAPIFAVILGALLLGEGLSLARWCLLLLAFMGVVLISDFDPRISPTELGIALIGALSGGAAYFMIRMLRKTDHPLVVVLYFPLVSLPIVAPLSLPVWVWPASWMDALIVLIMGLTTQLAQVNLTKAYQAEPAGNVSVVAYLGAVLALIFGFLLWGETYHWISLLGILLVVASVAVSMFLKVHKPV